MKTQNILYLTKNRGDDNVYEKLKMTVQNIFPKYLQGKFKCQISVEFDTEKYLD